SLDGRTQTLPMLYQFGAADFHDIVSGGSLGSPPYAAGPGYDLATGRGTPVMKNLIADFVGNVTPTGPYFSISAPSSNVAGALFNVTVTALDQTGKTLTGYTGTVHFSASDGASLVPFNYSFTASDNGVHTFTNGVVFARA